jgi:hypothetical protein
MNSRILAGFLPLRAAFVVFVMASLIVHPCYHGPDSLRDLL